MAKQLVAFLIGVLVVWAISFGLLLAFQEQLGQYAGLAALPASLAPLAMAYWLHRRAGHPGNPFKGLQWGSTGWLMLVWFGGLAIGLVTVGLIVGLGFAELDTSLQGYVDTIVAQSECNGQPVPKEGLAFLPISGWITAIGGVTAGPWLGAFFAVLGTLPWFGWFARRHMINGKVATAGTLVVLSLIMGTMGGVIENPYQMDLSLPVRIALAGLGAATSMLGSFWLFLRTRSAFVPALYQSSLQGAIIGGYVFLANGDQLLMSLVATLAPLLVAVGLWVWKDPGGDELAVAAVATDGTPLSPSQVAAAEQAAQVPAGA